MAHRLGIIGGGNMGAAIVRGCINAGVLRGDEIIIAEVDPQKREQLQSLGCVVVNRAAEAVRAEQVMLAVKPQVFTDVAKEIADLLSDQTIVISIMAGLSSERIRGALHGRGRIVRVMPNMPCQIGAGMSAIALGANARLGDEALAVSIFNSLGRTVMVDESLMYAVTAVSGSGPAYVFLLVEAMESAALALGLEAPTARILVAQTVMGAGRLLVETGQPASELRQAVTSPGGTTAAAIEVFDQRRIVEIVLDALTAARDRGRKLDHL